MRHSLLIPILVTALLLAACSDDTSVDPNSVAHFVTTIVSNGFRVTGDGYHDVPFALPTDGSVFPTSLGWATMVEFSIAQRPAHDPEHLLVLLRFPTRRGTFSWMNQIAQPSDSSSVFATIEIAGKKYVSIEGATTVAFYRDVSANTVAGRFEGRLASAFGDTIVVSGGRFEAEVDQP
jgi:hypothetical protein